MCRAATCAPACGRLDPRKSTLLEPVLSLRRDDAAKLPKGQSLEADHPALLPGAHVPGRLAHPGHGERPGRRPARLGLRGNRRRSTTPGSRSRSSHKRPSRLILPFVPGVTAPTPLPPCPGLRGELLPGVQRLRSLDGLDDGAGVGAPVLLGVRRHVA